MCGVFFYVALAISSHRSTRARVVSGNGEAKQLAVGQTLAVGVLHAVEHRLLDKAQRRGKARDVTWGDRLDRRISRSPLAFVTAFGCLEEVGLELIGDL